MKQKGLVMLLLCVVLLMSAPLTVKAGSSKDREEDISLPFDDLLELEEIREGISELGFDDGIFWIMLVHDGQDPDDFTTNIQIEQAKLEPNRFYTVEISVVALWDEEECERNAQTFLQARFPQVVFAGSPNAFGAAAFGEHVKCVGQTMPVTASRDLRIHYVQGSAKALSFATDGDFANINAGDLLESESGLCLSPILDRGDKKEIPMIISFITYSIYTEPLKNADSNENQMNIWALQKMMGEDYTPAPATIVSRVNSQGKVIYRNSSDTAKTVAVMLIIAVVILTCAAVATVLTIVSKRRKQESDNNDYNSGTNWH